MTSNDRRPFPTALEDFSSDERISFSRVDGTYLLVDENGEEWEFNETVNKWTQPINDEEVALVQSAYDVAPTTEDIEAAARPADGKRKHSPTGQDSKQKKMKVAAEARPQKPPENRAVFITGLPLDTKWAELDETFSKFGGMIDTGADGRKRIKMYEDDQGHFKGEALVVFFKRQSVDQAIQMLDDYQLRPGVAGCPNMRVVEAEWDRKKNKDVKAMHMGRKDKKKSEQMRAEMNRKLAEWSDDEASEVPVVTNKYSKIVILKNVFTLQELEEDPEVLMDIKEDIRKEAEKCGEVTNVVLYDREPEGIVSVRFTDAKDAQQFVYKTNGRFFGQQLESWVATERPRFKKSGRGTVSDEEEEEEERLEKFGTAV